MYIYVTLYVNSTDKRKWYKHEHKVPKTIYCGLSSTLLLIVIVNQEMLNLNLHPVVREVALVPLPREFPPIDWPILRRILGGA